MVILRTQSDFGHAPPPQTPYSIVTNLPGWDLLKSIRQGDTSPLARVVHIYPRLSPTQFVRTLSAEIAKKVGLEEKACMMYLDPVMWRYTKSHVAHELRREHAISPDRLTLKVVDVAGHRLYCVLYDPQHSRALMLSWGTPGLGLSIRQAEYLLDRVDTMVEVSFDDENAPPRPTWAPEGPDHEPLRQRINDLVHHGAIDPEKVKSQSKDVFLYPSGMAAVFTAKIILQDYRPNRTNVELGMVFHNTHELLREESPGGWKHFGSVDSEGLEMLETWLEKEEAEGRGATFVIVEFPSNPTLESPDLPRLKRMSERFSFVLIVDDTIGAFSNVDVLAQSDMLLTSLTKSFNGRSDALGGSIVLNPLSPHYQELQKRFAEGHHNQLSAADAKVLLSNSRDFFDRAARLNANAQAMAELLHRNMTEQPGSPIVGVQYPSLLPSKANYDAFMRRRTPELPHPGYGCLLTVNLAGVEAARAFYDRCGFYPSPHIGGHVTIMFAYNMFMFGKDPQEAEALRAYGIFEDSVRISAGLERVEDLLDTLQDALDAAAKVGRGGKEG
ncbi:uncharacterized protein UV8b_04663 [Ustilaginoidea virens]|uniref:Cystathionine gamma-synthase n=1 Tax=Ustilaginoidea virens TaxID=1159556 RepID=A0A8E5MIC2_USTVR|nr:uncharacterized protein UV8b_04663 [Ustilaginoidea virens]QUC20422.1 hypothetical protein UV8b_04663 [Ustilaginoidea virens]